MIRPWNRGVLYHPELVYFMLTVHYPTYKIATQHEILNSTELIWLFHLYSRFGQVATKWINANIYYLQTSASIKKRRP